MVTRNIEFNIDELGALHDRVCTGWEEHDPGDAESHRFWTQLVLKVEKACRKANVDVQLVFPPPWTKP